MSKKRFVVVCTERRGVFAGYVEDDSANPIVLTDAQMCVRWSEDVRGVVGLAAAGPSAGCRVTAPSPSAKLYSVTAVFDATPAAENAWQACPWA